MKKIFIPRSISVVGIALFCFLICIQVAVAQKLNVDSLVQKIADEKDENKKVDLLFSFYAPGFDTNPSVSMDEGKALLKLSEKTNDILVASSAYCFIGFGYRIAGNSIKALEFHQKALMLAEKAGNFSILAQAKNQMGHVYRDREEYNEALKLYTSALFDSERGVNMKVKAWPLMNIGAVNIKLGKPDSALYYLQRSYELIPKYDIIDLPFILWNLGAVHSLLGNDELAKTYFNMGINKAKETNRIRQLNWAYVSMAEHFQRRNRADSCLFYAKKAIDVVNHTAFFYMSIKPAKMLIDLYEKNNCDSSLKYTAIYKSANDSMFSKKTNQQIQLMTFDEDLRQQELAAEKVKEEEQQKQNIQFALIALGIVSFILIFFLLSRSIIVTEKWISFFGILGLLIVFEFINLLIHPFLERVTHHSPLLMLIALVVLASMLIPLHHRMEKWIEEKMTEKNKKIRLENAKKTIEKLEGETNKN